MKKNPPLTPTTQNLKEKISSTLSAYASTYPLAPCIFGFQNCWSPFLAWATTKLNLLHNIIYLLLPYKLCFSCNFYKFGCALHENWIGLKFLQIKCRLLGQRFEQGRNTKKNLSPPPPPKQEKTMAHHECMLSLPMGCMKFLFPPFLAWANGWVSDLGT